MTAPRQFTLAIFVVAGACSSGCGGGTLDGGMGGTAGAGTGAAGGQSGGPGGNSGQSGGAGGIGGSGGAAGAEPTSPPTSADPWPASCVTVSLDRPAGAASLTGPNPNSGRRDPPLPGEFIAAKLNGLARTFSTSLTVEVIDDGAMRWFSARVDGPDGEMGVVVPDGGPGSYLCPNAALAYSNVKGSPTIGNVWSSTCCRIDVTKAGGLPGETVEGTFSGILVSGGNETWIKVEEGSFKVVRRAGP